MISASPGAQIIIISRAKSGQARIGFRETISARRRRPRAPNSVARNAKNRTRRKKNMWPYLFKSWNELSIYIFMRRGAVCPRPRHYLCRWALGIRTRDSLSMLARPVHSVSPRAQINRSQPKRALQFLPCRTTNHLEKRERRDGTVGRTGSRSQPAVSFSHWCIAQPTRFISRFSLRKPRTTNQTFSLFTKCNNNQKSLKCVYIKLLYNRICINININITKV